ncbi:hypothetical protein C8F04DRAFT_98951 [Mycena alexandri]|uniref:Uncharacterized protein n=1 Tax=Mycena alexandri TaxID=1745969 RepID=A0AAD6XA57_9AGAR|nr:hypothetical protein C8F04DRAFT_98951 [Mycena alexandri]
MMFSRNISEILSRILACHYSDDTSYISAILALFSPMDLTQFKASRPHESLGHTLSSYGHLPLTRCAVLKHLSTLPPETLDGLSHRLSPLLPQIWAQDLQDCTNGCQICFAAVFPSFDDFEPYSSLPHAFLTLLICLPISNKPLKLHSNGKSTKTPRANMNGKWLLYYDVRFTLQCCGHGQMRRRCGVFALLHSLSRFRANTEFCAELDYEGCRAVLVSRCARSHACALCGNAPRRVHGCRRV